MDRERMLELAEGLAAAKSRQDIGAALALCHEDMLLETPAFGTTAHGLYENKGALARFFKSFPDYAITLLGSANNDDTLVCWGMAQMTLTGDQFGVTPNGRRTELPVYIEFSFKDNRIARERFFFDLSTLCAQSGVSTDVVRRTLFSDNASSIPASG